MHYLFMCFEVSVLLGEHTFRIAVSSWKTEPSVVMWYPSLLLRIPLFWGLLCQILMQPLQPLLMGVCMLCLFSSIYCTYWYLHIHSALRVFEVGPWHIPDIIRALSAQGGSSVFESTFSSRLQALEARWGLFTSSPHLWAQSLALSGHCTGEVTSSLCRSLKWLASGQPQGTDRVTAPKGHCLDWGACVQRCGGDWWVWSAGPGAAVS